MPARTRLPVKRLLANVPEIGWELYKSGFSSMAASYFMSAAVASDTQSWVVLALNYPNGMLSNTATRRLFLRHFEPVTAPRNWRDWFAVSRRFGGSPWMFYEQRRPRSLASPDAWNADYDLVHAGTQLRQIVDEPTDEIADGLLCPSLYSSHMLPMPSGLARYALMFYVSSLVRYKPTHLDPITTVTRRGYSIRSQPNQRYRCCKTHYLESWGRTYFILELPSDGEDLARKALQPEVIAGRRLREAGLNGLESGWQLRWCLPVPNPEHPHS